MNMVSDHNRALGLERKKSHLSDLESIISVLGDI